MLHGVSSLFVILRWLFQAERHPSQQMGLLPVVKEKQAGRTFAKTTATAGQAGKMPVLLSQIIVTRRMIYSSR